MVDLKPTTAFLRILRATPCSKFDYIKDFKSDFGFYLGRYNGIL